MPDIKQIDLGPSSYRPIILRNHPLIRKVLLRSTTIAAIYAALVIGVSRIMPHDLHWLYVLVLAFAPMWVVFYIGASLDD